LASGPAIAVRARAKAEAEPSRASALRDLTNGDVGSITGETIARAFAADDPMAREILQETTELLTCWLGNIVDLLDPDVIVIGGGVAAILKPFFPVISKTLPSWCVNPHAGQIPLLMAHYGADAGIAGGAALCA
jgi:glucokinase